MDPVEQRHRLAPERRQHVPVVDDPPAPPSRARVAPRQRHELLRARIHHQPVVVQPHPQPVSHQPRGHRVEHAAQREAARARHPHQRLLEAVAAPPRQRPQHRPLRVDPLPVAGVAVAYHLAQERPVLPGRLEIPRAPQQQRILDRPLQVPVRTLDRTVLVGPAPVVPAPLHVVVLQQRLIPRRQVLPCVALQVPKRRRQAVRPVLLRHAAQRPQRVLKPPGQRHVALPAQHHRHMAEPRVLQPEVVQLVRQRLPGDAHLQRPGIGEVRQAPAPRLVLLPEDDLLLRPVLRLPAPHPPLKRPPHPVVQLRMAAHHLLVQRHRPQSRARFQQRHDLPLEDPRQRIRAPSPPRLPLLRRPPGIRFDPVGCRRAEPRPRRRQRGTVLLPVNHVELLLVVRDLSARHLASLRSKGKHLTSGRPQPPPALSP